MKLKWDNYLHNDGSMFIGIDELPDEHDTKHETPYCTVETQDFRERIKIRFSDGDFWPLYLGENYIGNMQDEELYEIYKGIYNSLNHIKKSNNELLHYVQLKPKNNGK